MREVAIVEVKLYSENYYTNTIIIYKYSDYYYYKVEKEIATDYTANDRIAIVYKLANLNSDS